MFIRKFDFFICHFLNLWSIRVWDFSPTYPTLYRPPALLIFPPLWETESWDMRRRPDPWPALRCTWRAEMTRDWRHTSVTPVAWERVWDGDHQPPPCSTYSQLCRKIKQVSLIDQIHHSLSHCTVSVISVSRAPIGLQLARSQLWTNRRARHGEHDFIISHWGACRPDYHRFTRRKYLLELSIKTRLSAQTPPDRRRAPVRSVRRGRRAVTICCEVIFLSVVAAAVRCPVMALLEIGAQNTDSDCCVFPSAWSF